MRDEKWLAQLLDTVWDEHFSDVPQDNIVRIRFGRKAKHRLGSIMMDPKEADVSLITMNGIFRDESVPEFVVKATLVHEMTHYAHGFNSPLMRKQAHPHAGGVMRREFDERGLLALYKDQKKWIKENWPRVVVEHLGEKAVTYRRRSAKVPKPFWFLGN
jgi:hypothetical protein